MKKTITFSFFIFLLLSCNHNSNKNRLGQSNDSIVKLIHRVNSKNLNPQKKIEVANRAFNILVNNNNDYINRQRLLDIANVYYTINANSQLKLVLKEVIARSIEKKDTSSVAKAYNTFGNLYINLGKNDSAYFYVIKSEKLFRKLNDSLNLGKNYLDKAYIQLYESDYSGAELSSIQALNNLKNYNEKLREYQAFNLIGISSNELKNYDNALNYHKKALDYVAKYPEINQSKIHYRSSTLNNIGYVYQNIENYKEAEWNFRQALNETNLLKDNPDIYAAVVDNLAYSKFKQHDFSSLPKLFYEALKVREDNSLYSGIVANKIHLSEFFSSIKDTINSQKYANEALQLAKNTKISGDVLGALKQLSIVEHKLSSLYSKEYIKISDSLQLEERKAKDKFARIAFETDEIIQEKDKLAEQNRSLLYFFVGTLFVGLLLFVIRTQRAKNRELLLKQQQQKANEEIYNLMISQQATIEENRVREKKRIAQELHDGVLGRLFGARLNLDSLNRSTDEESINSRFNYLNELKNIEQDIREISHDLNREKHALINNFVAIVHNLLDEQSNSFEPVLTFSIDEKIKWESIGNNTKINLYRILQESLQNINKYAQAKHIHVEFKTDGNLLTLKVTDDGVGFEVDTKKRGIGLQNMLSRTSESEGAFEVQSKKGKGTSITVSVPLIKNEIEA